MEEGVDENLKEFGNKIAMEETTSKDLNDDKIKTIERRLYILEKGRLGSDFCEHCDEEFNLLTCEMYTCSVCAYKHKRLSELKNHCKTKHSRNTIIRHSKMDRENFSKLFFSNHFYEEI